jgi:MscS family membrane protein
MSPENIMLKERMILSYKLLSKSVIIASMEMRYYWLIEALIGVGIVLGLQYGLKKILSRSGKADENSWRRSLGTILQPPMTVLIWILAALFFMDVIAEPVGLEIVVKYLSAVRKTAVVGCSAWVFFRWKKEFELTLATQPLKKVDGATIRVIGRLASIIIGVLTGLIILQIFGVNTAPLLAFGSIGAASIGFAGKDVMANFCSGIMLQISRPFVEGDQIFLPEKKLEGHIEEIGWFRTTIRDKDKYVVYLPNNWFSTNLVVNISRLTHRHFKQIIKVPLNIVHKLPEALEKIRKTITQIAEIDTTLPIHVFLKTFGDYACEIEIEAYSTIIDQGQYNRFHQILLLKIQDDLTSLEIPVAVPIMTWKQIS